MRNVSFLRAPDALSRLGNFLSDFINIKLLKKLPSFYYNKVDNVGDRLNSYLLQQVTGKEVYIVKSKKFPHILPTGSILHFSSDSSYVWGSGLISPDQPRKVKFSKILALRGSLTLAEIRKQTDIELDLPLGDPGLLMPRYYKAKPSARRYAIGIVPHYIDQDSEILKPFVDRTDVKIISVQQNYDSFINELSICDYILSSSLHGLILSDAYRVPNTWISMSNNIIGGEFKFKDYYSTTLNPGEACHYLKGTSDLQALIECISSRASVKKYTGDLNKLVEKLEGFV